jgi:excisionase family DNA binding protein
MTQTTNTNDALLTMADACALLKVSKVTLYRRTSKKEIPFAKMPGSNKLLFSKDELLKWVFSNRK